MHRTEEQFLVICEACGAEVDADMDRVFPCDTETFLCFECAVARGGVFDEGTSRWVVSPEALEVAVNA